MTLDLPYQALFEASPLAMWVEDPRAGAFLAVNPAALSLFGHGREDFLGLAPQTLLAPAAAEGGQQRAQHRDRAGRTLHLELSRVPLAYAGRQVELVVAADVSRRVAADAEQRRAQVLLRAAGRVARIGGWLLDVERQRFEWSDEARLLFEAEPGFAPSLDEAILLCAPEWRDRVRALLDELLREGRPFREEVEVLTLRGRRFWARISAEPLRDAAGRVQGVEGAVQNITDERNARAWSEARLRHFLDAMPAPIWSADPDGRLDYANRVLYDYVGLTPESFHPSRWPELVHPDDRERAVAVSDAAYRAGRPYACELRLRGRDGGYRWHLDAGSPLRDEQGTILKYYGTVTDIHDIKLAEEALRDREARLRTIFEHEPECVKVVSAEGLLLEMNPAGLRMLRATSLGAILGRPTVDLVHPDDRASYLELHRRALAGESGQLVYRVIDLGGGERWMESNAALLRGGEGQADAVLSVTRDITERRRTEAALMSALKRNEMILASSGEGIQGFEADGRLAFVNEAALRMLGYAEAELRGRQLHTLLHHHRANGEPYPSADCPIQQTLRDGRTRAVENEVFFRKDGSSFPVE
jgi:PAS domain S-box-containing protein